MGNPLTDQTLVKCLDPTLEKETYDHLGHFDSSRLFAKPARAPTIDPSKLQLASARDAARNSAAERAQTDFIH